MAGTRNSMFSLLKIVLVSCALLHESETAHTFLELLEDPEDIQTLVTAASFLAQYGYISPEKGNASPDEMNATEISSAIRKMQKYAAVNQTGILDQATVRMIRTPRCGVHDEPDDIKDTRVEKDASEEGEGGRSGARSKRYVLAGLQYKWNKNDITYRINNYPDRTRSRITPAQVRKDTKKAFEVWSGVTPLSFTEVDNGEEADMVILFGDYHHTDIPGDPTFDGPGGTLGHAFFPNSGWGDANGDVHLDDSETFIHREFAEGTDYFYTVCHEIGHALGMAHAADRGSLMFPYDKGYQPDFKLPLDDILGIQLLYGPNPSAASNDVVTAPPEHEICSRGVDSLTMINDVLHVFSGDKFWTFSDNKEMIGPINGTISREYFKKLNRGIAAIYTRWDGKVFFIKGKNYWSYEGRRKTTGTPRKMADIGVPKSPNAAMHDGDQRHTYFFKWSKVWKYNERTGQVMDGFPKGVHKVFDGLPPKSEVKAAYIDNRGNRHLLVGRQYYRFANGDDQLDPGYPKDFLVEYFDCPPPAP